MKAVNAFVSTRKENDVPCSDIPNHVSDLNGSWLHRANWYKELWTRMCYTSEQVHDHVVAAWLFLDFRALLSLSTLRFLVLVSSSFFAFVFTGSAAEGGLSTAMLSSASVLTVEPNGTKACLSISFGYDGLGGFCCLAQDMSSPSSVGGFKDGSVGRAEITRWRVGTLVAMGDEGMFQYIVGVHRKDSSHRHTTFRVSCAEVRDMSKF